MSIIYCFGCDKFIDTDIEEVHDYDDFTMICINCYEEENNES